MTGSRSDTKDALAQLKVPINAATLWEARWNIFRGKSEAQQRALLADHDLFRDHPIPALALYDADIRAEKTDDYRDISNGASLLARLELEGVNVGNRWDELADLSEKRATDGCLAFADLHYILALCGGDRHRAATGLIAALQPWPAATLE